TLVQPRDVEALAVAIERYALNEFLRKRHGKAGRIRALSDFSQEPIWNAVHNEYIRLMNGF
ncbi:glycosyltransferase family 1 protein, partial [bacterium]|nr:glycosyltransferase family 1 protein [bacterium]